MNLFDFIAQAGFWQWVGLLIVLNLIVDGIVAICKAIVAKRKDP